MGFCGGRGGLQSGRSCNIEASTDSQQQSGKQKCHLRGKKNKESGGRKVQGDGEGGDGKQESDWKMETFYHFSQVKRLAGRWTGKRERICTRLRLSCLVPSACGWGATSFFGRLWKQLLNFILLTHTLLLTSLAACYHGHQGRVSMVTIGFGPKKFPWKFLTAQQAALYNNSSNLLSSETDFILFWLTTYFVTFSE